MTDPANPRLGFIYVLTNPHFRSSDGRPLLKIGATRKHPIRRTRELGASTGVPGEFTLSYYRDFDDCFAAETLLHQRLSDRRPNESREFFDISIEDAIQAIDEIVGKNEKVGSGGIVATCHRVREIQTPWAELFASFTPSDDPYLNEQERSQCRDLERRLSNRSDHLS